MITGLNHPVGWSSHTLTNDGTWLILFGGIVDITKEINELHQFDCNNKTWSVIDDNIEHEEGVEFSPSPARWRELAPVEKTHDDSKNMTTMSSPGRSPNKSGWDRNFYLPKEIPKKANKSSKKKN